MKFSTRSSIHLIGAPSAREPAGITSSSGWNTAFGPKAPPTSGAITRSCVSSRPSALTRIDFARCGIWVLAQTVSCRFGGIEARENRARFERMAAALVQLEAHRDAMRGAREGVVDVAVFDDMLGDEIVGTIETRARRAGRESCDRIGDGGKRIGVDLDQAKRVFGDGAALGDHERDRLAHIGELVARERIGIDRRSGSRPTAAPAECGRRSRCGRRSA